MKLTSKLCLITILLGSLSAAAFAQAKKAMSPTPTPEAKADAPAKRNERPGADPKKTDAKTETGAAAPTYFYEFTRPGFTYSRILIEHNDAGKGKISFLRDGDDEAITDPIVLSTVTMAKINGVLADLKFLDSTEDYQYVKGYSHLGNVVFTLKRDGRERTAKYNWTENPGAKALMDEYRRISNEYTWRFEISVARENQPLLTPGLVDALDAYIRRDEISDPAHMLPFLTPLSTDERLPLMARNRAVKIIKEIEKQKPK